MKNIKNKKLLIQGFRDGIPIGLGYFAVAFSLGITAYKVGFSAFCGFLMSATMYASAGEYALIQSVFASSLFLEVVLITLVANARYVLMSCALSQRLNPNTKFFHRFIMGMFITDEFFGITVTKNDYAEPFYMYGAILFAAPCWAIGTLFGVAIGNVLPEIIVSALSVSLYGMFLSIIIPQAKNSLVIAITVIISFVSSYLLSLVEFFKKNSNWEIIILTIVISVAVAIICPIKDKEVVSEGVKDNV